jgi:hypothetical protein
MPSEHSVSNMSQDCVVASSVPLISYLAMLQNWIHMLAFWILFSSALGQHLLVDPEGYVRFIDTTASIQNVQKMVTCHG